ncbi:BTB/POZ and MATH domain-containing protein 3-like [Oryza sativa Japonica Group]|uniref:BTB/POZ and MATH domain-containing protein 3-like n=1 Tax=Oryza sativa subsp. japonica TaxID=39947 RepID=UPI00339CE366
MRPKIQQCPPNARLHGVSFVVGGETFPAHRAVLAARSPVFRAELLGPMAEAKMSRITIHDVEPVTFRAMLRFIYTDELEEKDSMATDLLQNLVAVADRYDLSRLKLMCAQKLWEKVSVENVATMLIYAEMHGCPELKTSCLDFFVQEENFKVAVLNEGYAQLVQHFPSVIDEIKGLLGAKTMQWSEN